MVAENAPDLRSATPGPVLVEKLKTGCPLTLPLRLDDGHLQWVHAWQVPVKLPLEEHSVYQQVPVDLTPLQALYDQHAEESGPPRTWLHEFYYLEVLAQEGRVQPAFWFDPDRWTVARRLCKVSLQGAPQRGIEPDPEGWEEKWSDLIEDGVVQAPSPEAWLEMLEWDQEMANEYGTFEKALQWGMVPVYKPGSVKGVKRCMREDIAEVMFVVPEEPADLMNRWRTWAGRLGLRQRWRTAGEQRLDRRKQLVKELLLDEEYPSDIAHHLVEVDLYPVYPKTHDSWYDEEDRLKNAERTVHRLVRELKEEGHISEDRINRRPRGRPPKNEE